MNYIATGFSQFDSKTGGLPRSGVTLITSASGTGSSVLSTQLALNFHAQKLATIRLLTELSEDIEQARIVSNVSGVPVLDIINKRFTEDQTKELKSACKRHSESDDNSLQICSITSYQDMVKLVKGSNDADSRFDVVLVDPVFFEMDFNVLKDVLPTIKQLQTLYPHHLILHTRDTPETVQCHQWLQTNVPNAGHWHLSFDSGSSCLDINTVGTSQPDCNFVVEMDLVRMRVRSK